MPTTLTPVDVVVVGAGAAGGLAAERLVAAGLDVVALEAGEWLRPQDIRPDELVYGIDNALGGKFNSEVPTWRADPETSASTAVTGRGVSRVMNAVGGTSVNYGAQHFRFAPWNFRVRSSSEARYGSGVFAADCTVVDWPIGYDDLEPYYEQVERLIGVCGTVGNLGGRLVPGGNPFEGFRASDYPVPALRRSGWNDLMADAGRRYGWHPFAGPAAIDSRRCTYCGFCNRGACRVGAKSATSHGAIPRAVAAGLRLVSGARVMEVLVDRSGQASGVTYLRDGQAFVQPARCVYLAAHTWENVRLLLLSRGPAFPDGLANNHRQVGRNMMTHIYAGVNGLFPGLDLARFNGSVAQATCYDDLNCDNFDHTGLEFVGGGCISATQEQHPIATALATPPTVARWGSAWTDWLARHGRSVGSVNATLESLPYADHRIDLDPQVRDPQGVPVLRVTYRLREQEVARWRYFIDRISELLVEAGASQTWATTAPRPNAPFPSVYGATRIGASPNDSVLDGWGLAHEVPNLAVAGAGCFPTSGGYNPTATIQAFALRTADRIVAAWGAITS